MRRLSDQRRAILGLDQPKRQVLPPGGENEGNPTEFVVRLTKEEVP
jgi:hypothetical protein